MRVFLTELVKTSLDTVFISSPYVAPHSVTGLMQVSVTQEFNLKDMVYTLILNDFSSVRERE